MTERVEIAKLDGAPTQSEIAVAKSAIAAAAKCRRVVEVQERGGWIIFLARVPKAKA